MSEVLHHLADTVYRDSVIEIVDAFVDEYGVPVTRAQIHGLRQISVQQPGSIKTFATRQGDRIQAKLKSVGPSKQAKLNGQVVFWKLVADLCQSRRLEWSPAVEAESWMPEELREENIPSKESCKSNEERSHRKRLKHRQKEWIEEWNAKHLPVFFQRFCTHYLYHLGKREDASR